LTGDSFESRKILGGTDRTHLLPDDISGPAFSGGLKDLGFILFEIGEIDLFLRTLATGGRSCPKRLGFLLRTLDVELFFRSPESSIGHDLFASDSPGCASRLLGEDGLLEGRSGGSAFGLSHGNRSAGGTGRFTDTALRPAFPKILNRFDDSTGKGCCPTEDLGIYVELARLKPGGTGTDSPERS
jgi:hypothetical protein